MIPDGFVVCPACNGSCESEHWTTCELCLEWAEKDPRYTQVVVWQSYVPHGVAVEYVDEQLAVWTAARAHLGNQEDK